MPVFTSISVVEYMAKAAIAVKLTSMPPETSTSRTPMAKMPSTIELRSRSNRVGRETKEESTAVVSAQKATTTRKTSVSLRVQSILMRPPVSHDANASASSRSEVALLATSFTIRPPFMTRMRWQQARSSGRSSEITMVPSRSADRPAMIW